MEFADPTYARSASAVEVHEAQVPALVPGSPELRAPPQVGVHKGCEAESGPISIGAMIFPSARSVAFSTMGTPSPRTQGGPPRSKRLAADAPSTASRARNEPFKPAARASLVQTASAAARPRPEDSTV